MLKFKYMPVKKIILFAVIALVLISTVLIFVKKNGNYNLFDVERRDFKEVVELSGKVVPAEELDLSFEVIGKVTRVNINTGDVVRRGEILVELDISEINSELSEVLSNLEKEKMLLSEILNNSDNQSKLENESRNLINTIKKSFITSEDIVRNIVDVFFEDPNKRFPDFTNALGDYFLRQEINNTRREIGLLLEEWKIDLEDLSVDSVSQQDADDAINNLKTVESFLALITSQVDEFNPIASLTQSQIDAYLSNISNSRKTMASLIVEINSVYNSYRDVLASIPLAESSVGGAEATVQKLSARKGKYILRAPFDGIITDKNVDVGVVVSAGENIISMISNNTFEVESFVPELNIIGVDVGDKATLRFDAFSQERLFDATVSHIDPRETIKDGITTYKILLSFDEPIPDVRSGMTNDIEVVKDLIPNKIVIPRYLIQEDEDSSEYVYLLDSDNKVKREVKTGRIDGMGGIIIEEGLSEGDQIIIEE